MNLGPIIEAPAGRFQTLRRKAGASTVLQALAIRYATAKRFAPPVPAVETAEIIDATTPADACPQPHFESDALRIDMTGGLTESEDCLRLSVTMPADIGRDEALPVIVWIHGGAYVAGAGDAPVYDPSAMVLEQRLIMVSVTYRLGVFGYCGSRTRPWNLGLLDQREALRWVQRNIAHFGGDPHLVTAMGQSAGGDSIYHLMESDDVLDNETPLFQRAIIQSAPVGLVGARRGIENAYAPVIDPLPNDGPTPDPDKLHKQILGAQIRNSAKRLGTRGVVPYYVEYGHPPLPRDKQAPAHINRHANTLEVLIGTNTREGTLCLAMVPPLDAVHSVPLLGSSVAEAVIRISTRYVFDRPTDAFVRRFRKAGGRVTRYHFLGGNSGTVMRAGHIAELPYLFPGPAWESTAFIAPSTWQEVGRVGAAIRASWGSFARTGRAAPVPGLIDLS